MAAALAGIHGDARHIAQRVLQTGNRLVLELHLFDGVDGLGDVLDRRSVQIKVEVLQIGAFRICRAFYGHRRQYHIIRLGRFRKAAGYRDTEH